MSLSTEKTTAAAIARIAVGKPAAHVDRYFTRVDTYLKDVLPSDDLRIEFLSREFVKWTGRYETWTRKVDAGLPTDDEVAVWDYLDTLSGLDQRRREIKDRQ